MSDTNQTPAAISVASNREEQGPARRKRILLAEGDGFTRLVLLFRLRLAGFGVDFTSNGILGLGKLRSRHPDVLLVELKLVGLSGLELIRAARQDPEFGTRPIYVFTHAEAMSRATRKEVQMLATKVFDKGTVTREDLVTTLSSLLVEPVADGEQSPAIAAAEPEAEPLAETVLPGELEEIIEGVRKQSKLLAQSLDAIARAETGGELLSRVRSLSSCAEAAGLRNLARQTKALEDFLAQLSKAGQPCPDSALSAVTRAVELMGAISRECAKGQSLREFRAVVVDEDPFSGKAIAQALSQESVLFHASLDEPIFMVDPSTFSGPVPEIASFKPASPAANKKAQAERGKATVLFVEDDPFVLRVYRKCLKREGFHVEVAEDGLAAIEVLPRIRPDVVVLDLMLPKLNGLEVLKFIRSDGDLSDTPVLVLSNAYLEGLATKANQAGANRGLLKTECTPAKLVQALRDLLGSPGVRPSPAPAPYEPEVEAPPDEPGSAAETAIWTRQADLHKDAPEEITKIRHACQSYIQATGAEERLANLTELYRRVRFLSARAGLSGLTKIAELCSALEGLLFQIVFKQSETTASTFQTIAQAVDCLDRLSQNHDTTFLEPRTKARVLVVDDDPICNLAMVTALKRSGFETTGLQDPLDSLGALNSGAFDLIVLDINMPKMTGFEVCEYLRRMPRYKSVPVIFIATDGEFQNRSRSVVSGGNDLMSKPICALELIVKGTMHLLNSPNQGVSESVDASHQPLAWSLEPAVEDRVMEAAPGSHATTPSNVCAPGDVLLTDSEIPCELFRRAEPSVAATDGQAETFSGSPADEVAPLQADDRRLETTQPSGLQPNATGLTKPEPTVEDQTAEAQPQAEAESHELAALEPQVEQELLAPTAEEAPQSSDSAERQLEAVVPVAGDVEKSEQVAGPGVTALARAVADLAMERGQRQRSEQRGAALNAQLQALHEEFSRALQAQQAGLEQIGTLEDQLRRTEEALAQRNTDFEQQQSEHQLAEEQLQIAKDLNSQLQKHIALSDGANRTFERMRQELQSKLETAMGALRESEARAQKEASERQRLKEALDSAQLGHQERAQQSDLEHSKLQTALQLEQLERARQETELARMRHKSLDAAHDVRALGNNLRRQIREPVENLCQSARSLLELEMSEQQRKLAETVLQYALTVHSRLQQAGTPQADSSNAMSHEETSVCSAALGHVAEK